jgi:prolipoprotein diacylglyceryltransferase
VSQLLYIPWFKAEEIDLGVPIQPFGILVAIGVLLAVRVAEEFGKRQGIHPRVMADHATHVVVGGFIGAYFGNKIIYEPEKAAEYIPYLALLAPIAGAALIAVLIGRFFGDRLSSLPEAGFISKRSVPWLAGLVLMAVPAYFAVTYVLSSGIEYLGLSSYTGFAGSVVGLLVWKWRRGISMIAVGDLSLFAFPVGWIFGRTGCFITHDHPGAITDFFLGVENWGSPTAEHIPFFGYGTNEPTGIVRHDLGFYEVLWSIAVMVLFFALATKRRRRGFYMGLICVLYAPIRFFLDFLRAEPVDQGDIRYLGLTPGQYGSIALFLTGVAVWWWIYSHPEVTVPKEAAWPPADEDEDQPKPAKKSPTGSKKKVKRKVARKKPVATQPKPTEAS